MGPAATSAGAQIDATALSSRSIMRLALFFLRVGGQILESEYAQPDLSYGWSVAGM